MAGALSAGLGRLKLLPETSTTWRNTSRTMRRDTRHCTLLQKSQKAEPGPGGPHMTQIIDHANCPTRGSASHVLVQSCPDQKHYTAGRQNNHQKDLCVLATMLVTTQRMLPHPDDHHMHTHNVGPVIHSCTAPCEVRRHSCTGCRPPPKHTHTLSLLPPLSLSLCVLCDVEAGCCG